MSSRFNSSNIRNKTPPVCQKHVPSTAPLPVALPEIIHGTITVVFNPVDHVTPIQFTHALRHTPATNIWQASNIIVDDRVWFLGLITDDDGRIGGCSWSVFETGVPATQGTGLYKTTLSEIPLDTGQHVCTFNQFAIESRYRFFL